jgi:carbon storage regulator CsrA
MAGNCSQGNGLLNTNQGSVSMLVLTRKYQEKIRIGDNITITVLRTKGKAVRLGIEAPADVPVLRGELSFEPAAAGLAASDGSCAASSTAVAAGKQRSASRGPSNASWTAEPPRRADEARVSPSVGQVSLGRVPREKAAGILPQFVSGSGPLRAMMDQR